MPAAQQNGPGSQSGTGLGGRKLADLSGLFDSPMDAEAAGALHRIRVLKKKQGDPPFYVLVESGDYKAATWEKYGGCTRPCKADGTCHHGPSALREWFEKKHGGGDSAALREALTLVEKLRRDKAELEKHGAPLANAVKDRDEIIIGLRREIAALQNTLRAMPDARNASCRSCDITGRLLIGGLGLIVATASLCLVPWGSGDQLEMGFWLVLTGGPVVVAVCGTVREVLKEKVKTLAVAKHRRLEGKGK